MRTPRLSIAGLMLGVVIVALNLAVGRYLFGYQSEILVGIALGAITLQVAIIQLIRRRGRDRAFWVGFLVLGSLVMASFIWAMCFSEILGFHPDGRGGFTLIRTPGSLLYTLWNGYSRFVYERIIETYLIDFRANEQFYRDSMMGRVLLTMIRALAWFIPQLLIAVIGGVVARLIAGPRGRLATAGDEAASANGHR